MEHAFTRKNSFFIWNSYSTRNLVVLFAQPGNIIGCSFLYLPCLVLFRFLNLWVFTFIIYRYFSEMRVDSTVIISSNNISAIFFLLPPSVTMIRYMLQLFILCSMYLNLCLIFSTSMISVLFFFSGSNSLLKSFTEF